MAEVKLTKNALRELQTKLSQLQKYSPTLQLKKSMLQLEVNEAKSQLMSIIGRLEQQKEKIKDIAPLLSTNDVMGLEKIDVLPFLEIKEVHKYLDNIAGVEFYTLDRVEFNEIEYYTFDHPIWLESAVKELRELIILGQTARLVEEKKEALQHELRQVSIRVNLFDKVLIPRAIDNIKKIKIFLQDQYLAAVSQAKVAKEKILKKAAL
jgi:V/A-type H+-transporting ATPase subunit D